MGKSDSCRKALPKKQAMIDHALAAHFKHLKMRVSGQKGWVGRKPRSTEMLHAADTYEFAAYKLLADGKLLEAKRCFDAAGYFLAESKKEAKKERRRARP